MKKTLQEPSFVQNIDEEELVRTKLVRTRGGLQLECSCMSNFGKKAEM